ncbi:MAG: glycosyltransferase [Acidobacteria bacterium]|nr:glycosyltransferase [Acidobacteriota bacterium]
MSGLRLSVVIPVLDMAGSIGPCLDALLAQSYPRALTEIVVVDNGSTDGTRAIVERYPVTCLVERRPGAPSARNRGIEAATGDYVVFTDADCVPVRTWLARLAAAATAHDADAVGGGLAVLDPSASLLARYSAVIGQYDPDATLRHPRYPYAATANVAIRRSLLQAAGGFDPSFTTYDAAELFWRLSQARPLATALEPRALVFYRTRSTVAALARQNFNYGVGYARFCNAVPDAGDAARAGQVMRRWWQRIGRGLAQLSTGPTGSWRDAAGLRAVHLVRETALAAGTLAGQRRFARSPIA